MVFSEVEIKNLAERTWWEKFLLLFKRKIYSHQKLTDITTNTYEYKKLKGKLYLIDSYGTTNFRLPEIVIEKRI